MNYIPYGRQTIDENDIHGVIEALQSDFITTGPKVGEFEDAIAARTGSRFGVAVSSGTAALHAAMHALDIKAGDEVIVTPMTFAASANCILYQGGTPVFADVSADTLLIDPQKARAAITPRTKAIIGVDYAGQPCDWGALREIAASHGLALVADACHALGATDSGSPVGSLADITVFSFHPVKHITSGEGGMAVTSDERLAKEMRQFRGHGITTTAFEREQNNSWQYDMADLGFNYRITDFQCALGLSQLAKLDKWLETRRRLAARYDALLADGSAVPLAKRPHAEHAYHLYVARVPERDQLFREMRNANIGVNVHYRPVHLHSYYRKNLGTCEGLCPIAEKAAKEILTLPLWPGMSEDDVDRIVECMHKFLK